MGASPAAFKDQLRRLLAWEVGEQFPLPGQEQLWVRILPNVFETVSGDRRLSGERLAQLITGISEIPPGEETPPAPRPPASQPRVTAPATDPTPAVRPAKPEPVAVPVRAKARPKPAAKTPAKAPAKPRLPARLRGPRIESTADTLRRMETSRSALRNQIKALRAELKRLSCEEKDFTETIDLLRPLVQRRASGG